jgi:hypothetical protein
LADVDISLGVAREMARLQAFPKGAIIFLNKIES